MVNVEIPPGGNLEARAREARYRAAREYAAGRVITMEQYDESRHATATTNCRLRGAAARFPGDRFIAVEFEGNGHRVLTEHVQEEGVARVLAFLEERLR